MPIPPASLRVTAPPASTRVTVPPAAPRVKIPPVYIPPSPPTVSLPVHPHFIKSDYNGDNVNVIAFPRYRLLSHHQQRTFSAQEPHYIADHTSAMAHPPRFSPGTGPRYSQATWHIIATEHRHKNHANTVIGTDTVQYIENSHPICGPDKDIWTTSLGNDLGRITQGVGTRIPTGTNTVFFIPRSTIPTKRTVTNSLLVARI